MIHVDYKTYVNLNVIKMIHVDYKTYVNFNVIKWFMLIIKAM